MDDLIEQAPDSPQFPERWHLTAPRVSLSCESENIRHHLMHKVFFGTVKVFKNDSIHNV